MKRSIKEERQRSARKTAEIDAEVNTNKELVYQYIAARKDVLGMACVTELGMFDKGKRYLEWLALHGYLTRMKRTVNSKRQYVYNAVKPFVKPVQDNEAIKVSQDQLAVQKVTRVFRLLDRERIPQHKSERTHKAYTGYGSMQSSINSFGSW
jgi:hypothetical protein